MSSNRFQDAKRIYGVALECEPDQLAAYLAEACAGDDALRKEVESLLGCRAAAHRFFEVPAIEASAKVLARESSASLAGRTLSHYACLEKIGEGGMGAVYRARDTRLDRFVALKIVPPEKVIDPDRKRRFVQEAQAASALNHPNIVTIHDIDTAEGITFIVMEFVKGRTLGELIREKCVSVTEALKYGAQIAEALAAAHSAGIIHRDIKPANVMVMDSGVVKVLDFGAAKLRDPANTDEGAFARRPEQKTKAGLILGTVAYMSPEQAEGKEVDARSDIFSLGSVLYEMITGKRAFSAETDAATLAAITRDEPKAISELAPGIPREIERVVVRCLRKNAARRFQDMADLKVALEELKEESETGLLARAVQASSQLKRIVLVGSVALAIVTFGVVAYRITKPPPMPHIVASHALTKTGNRKTWEWSRLVSDGTRVYFRERRLSRLATLQVPLSGGEVSELDIKSGDSGGLYDISRNGSQLLMAVRDANGSQRETDAWVQPLPTGAPRLIARDAQFPLWSSDDRSILFMRRDKELYRVNADGTNTRKLTEFPDITDLAESPDGRRVRTGDSITGTLWEVASDGSNPHPIFKEHADSLAMGNWSFDSRYFFFLSWDGDRFNLWVSSEERHWWKRGPPPSRQLTFGPLWIGTPSVSRDGRQVYAIGKEPHGELVVYDQRTGEFVPYLGGISACYVDYSRDGQWITYVSYPEGTLWRARVDGTERRQLTVPPLAVMVPRWSPDGTQIAFKEVSGGNRRQLAGKARIYVVSADGGGPTPLLSGDRSYGDPTWSADGAALAYHVGAVDMPQTELMILDLRTQKSTKIPGSEGYRYPRWSPDGKYLVANLGLPPSRLGLYSLASQEWQTLGSASLAWPSWSRDSKFIYAVDGNSLVRIATSGHKSERIAPVPKFPTTAYFLDRWGQGWFGITPDGRPLTTRDSGLEEIYAFDLEYE